MAKGNFAVVMKPLLAHEGGVSNRSKRDDPGGLTNRGVTQKTYDGYRRYKHLPSQPVTSMSTEEYLDIYKVFFWDAIRGDDLPGGVDYAVFDGAVNSGPKQAGLWLQRSLPDIEFKGGNIGPQTISALRDANHEEVIVSICSQRLAFMKTLSNWEANKKGWSRRVADVRRIALSMVKQDEALFAATEIPEPIHLPAEATAKAEAKDVNVIDTLEGNQAAKQTGLGVWTGVWTMISGASEYISLVTGLPPKYLNIIILVAIIAGVIGIVTFGVMALLEVVKRKKYGESMEAN